MTAVTEDPFCACTKIGPVGSMVRRVFQWILYKRQTGLLLLLMLAGLQHVSAAPLPQQTAFWGIMTEDAKEPGVVVTGLRSDGPGAACLQAGDILLAINDKAIRSQRDFDSVKDRFPLFTVLDLTVKRAGTVRKCQIVLEGISALRVLPIKSDFFIPGVPPPPTTAPSPIEALDQVNVLDQVLLDPKTGQIEIIGHYDARFKTGSIPYLDILKTALRYAEPKLDLQPSYRDPASGDTAPMDVKIRKWMWDGKDFVLGHPDLEQERQLLIRAWASACGLSPEDLVKLYNYTRFGPREVKPPQDIREIQGKLFTNLGFTRAAQAYELVSQADSEAALKALQLLGQAAEGRIILAHSSTEPDKGLGKLTATVYLALMENIYSNAGMANMLREDLAEGRITWEHAVMEAQGELFPVRTQTDQREIAKVALNKIELRTTSSQILIETPLNAEVVVKPIDVEPNSQLNRILYEGDYSLKSMTSFPELFWHISGSMSDKEYMISKRLLITRSKQKYVTTSSWLEPKSVSMLVSPDRRVVTFGVAEISHKTKTYYTKPEDRQKYDDIGDDYQDWAAGITNHYDEYASVLPALHKVREAAKVIALARWLLGENIAVGLSHITQEGWRMPAKVPGFWTSGFAYFDVTGKGTYELYRQDGASFNGGVTFKKSGWIATQPSAVGETKVAEQLALSAVLGQKAVQAAQNDNLEQARYLAEMSAQAMNGSISKTELAKLNIPLPDANLPAPVPANVQLQKEMIKRTYQQITSAKDSTSSKEALAGNLAQLNKLYDHVRNRPVAASDYLLALQTGQLTSATASPSLPSPSPTVKPPARTVCEETTIGADMLPAERKAYLTNKLSEAQQRLRHINEALRKLIAINSSQQAEIDKLTAEISEAHEAAKERVSDFIWATLVDLPLAKYADVHEEKVKQMQHEITGLIGKSTTPMSEAEREILTADIIHKSALKMRYEDGFRSTKRLLELYASANIGKDIYKWELETKNSEDKKRWREAALLAGQIWLEHPKLQDFLSKQEWFGGDKLWQVTAMGKLAAYGSGFFWDVVNLYGAWVPQVANMQKDQQKNVQAMEEMRQKSLKLSQEIKCMEKLLQ